MPDKINGLFEALGALALLFHCRRLYLDKEIKGMSVIPTVFYTTWGFWNLFFYPSVGANWSVAGGILVVAVNVTYCGMLFHYWKRR